MANERFWNLDRISYFWGKIKSLVNSTANNKVDKVAGKGLSTNDYTDADQTALQTTLPGRISAIENAKGANSGYAELDANGKVPSSQLPSYVDDVEEHATVNDFPQTGESGKIYVATSTNITYRWGGSEYVPIGSDLALGETSSTAYRGDRGKAAYDHATAKGSAFNSGLYKITTNSEGHVTAASAVQKSDITDLGIPGEQASDMTGASSSAAGTHGLVPAPGIGAQNLFLRGDGIWEEATGAKLVPVELTVTNTSGAYTTTVQDSEITSDMKPVVLEINDPSIFNDEIIVTCNNGSITLSCDDVAGTSLVKVNVMKQAPSTVYITSDEYNALDQSKVDKNQGIANAGKILGINSSGMVAPITAGGLPPVTAADNGKFCMVVNGDWAAASIPAARGVSF